MHTEISIAVYSVQQIYNRLMHANDVDLFENGLSYSIVIAELITFVFTSIICLFTL